MTEDSKNIDYYIKQLIEECRARIEEIEDPPVGLRNILSTMLIIIDALRAKILIMQVFPNGH